MSFNGATGPENNFLIDGVNTTDPAFGLLGTQLTLEFIGETEIITGGYNAEYGRATGGVVNVITKSGSNNFHGDMWFYATPFQLDPHAHRRARARRSRRAPRPKYGFDFGFDLGGPIVKDKIWFYVGFQPTFTTTQFRPLSLRTRTANNLPPAMMAGAYQGDLDPSASAARRASTRRFCNTPGLLQPGYTRTCSISSFTKHYETDTRLYNWIAKFNFQLNPNNSLVLQYIGSPQTSTDSGIARRASTAPTRRILGSHLREHARRVAALRLQARRSPPAARHRRRLPLRRADQHAGDRGRRTAPGRVLPAGHRVARDLRAGRDAVRDAEPCTARRFNPCPVQNYVVGGFGFLDHTTMQRISAAASATYFARLGGTHALKLGFDFEDNIYTHTRNYTGGAFYRVNTDGSIEIYREYAQEVGRRERRPERPRHRAARHGFNSPRRRRSTTAPTCATRTTSASSPA